MRRRRRRVACWRTLSALGHSRSVALTSYISLARSLRTDCFSPLDLYEKPSPLPLAPSYLSSEGEREACITMPPVRALSRSGDGRRWARVGGVQWVMRERERAGGRAVFVAAAGGKGRAWSLGHDGGARKLRGGHKGGRVPGGVVERETGGRRPRSSRTSCRRRRRRRQGRPAHTRAFLVGGAAGASSRGMSLSLSLCGVACGRGAAQASAFPSWLIRRASGGGGQGLTCGSRPMRRLLLLLRRRRPWPGRQPSRATPPPSWPATASA